MQKTNYCNKKMVENFWRKERKSALPKKMPKNLFLLQRFFIFAP
jgi:hypothetical protein